jgi:hypothetical protein
MKRCPECYEVYENDEKFCEADGHELLADPTFSRRADVAAAAPPARSNWWPAATFGVLIGAALGAGIFAAATLLSVSETNEHPAAGRAVEVQEKAPSNRVIAASKSAPTPQPEESPSPDSDQEAEPEPSPVASTENNTAAVQLNQGPISTGQKKRSTESEAGIQTVIEMTDGSTLDVDAAWEDRQGIWYRRSGLVSFVESSRVKAITARKGTKTADISSR